MPAEIKQIETLPEDAEELTRLLTELDNNIKSNNTSPTAVLTLCKTMQSHNITIENWNKIVNFVSNNKQALDKMYGSLPAALSYIYNHTIAAAKDYTDANLKQHLNVTDIYLAYDGDDVVGGQ